MEHIDGYADPETAFLCELIKLQYGAAMKSRLQELSSQVPWAKGWPEDRQAFWNAEAFLWKRKIPRAIRDFIERQLQPLASGKNLDLGCGAYSYVPGSMGFDCSEKMLLLNERCQEKVKGSLEKPLPFADSSFDSVTAVFALNYVQNIDPLLLEVQRVLKQKGLFISIFSTTPVGDWQRQKEAQAWSRQKWQVALEKHFLVESKEEKGLWLFQGKKLIKEAPFFIKEKK